MSKSHAVDDRAARSAEAYIKIELQKFMRTIPLAEQADFFDGRNADGWQREFGQFLERAREFASND